MPANFYGLQGDRPPHQIIHEKSAAPDAKFHPKEEKKITRDRQSKPGEAAIRRRRTTTIEQGG